MPELAVWAILLLPLSAAAVNGLLVRPALGSSHRLGGVLTIGSIGAAFVLSLWVAAEAWTAEGHRIELPLREVVSIGNLQLQIGLLVNGLTAVMLVVVTGVSFLVQVYSHGYMREDPGYVRYYTFMALFTAAMLTLVLANNLVLLYVGWELVGLCSYLLIGFWYHRPSAAAAAKKAFIVTRFGDFFFLVAILGIFFLWPDGQPVTFVIDDPASTNDLYGAVGTTLAGTALTLIALGLFAGAMGKSAQFPLHTWLPDAMEGPTPVSALIHAATMVAAGVFLVARFLPFFTAEDAEGARTVVALIGVFTAVFAASMGLVMNDIKRVLAYSTVSQLGFMMMALGVGALGAAMFHLFNHAFFKALLFLGSGSVNHATGTFDMREMGGLRRFMPWTYLTFLVGALSLAGLPPFSGFWSKDEILAAAWLHEGGVAKIVFWGGLAAAFMTAFYIFRAFFMTFHGEPHTTAEAHDGAHDAGHGAHGRPHESPMVMVAPMVLLAILAIGSWVVNFPGTHLFSNFLEAEAEPFQGLVAGLSTVVAALGVGTAILIYQLRVVRPEAVGRAFGPLYPLLSRKYYMDELYEGIVVRRALYRGVWAALAWFDARVVDGIVDLVGWVGRHLGQGIARLQTGQMQTYAAVLSLGVVVIFIAYVVWGV